MALYWPKQKVALDIVDDPHYTLPPESDESWLTIPLSSADIGDYASYRRVMSRVADLLARNDASRSQAIHATQPAAPTLPKSA